MPQKPAKQLCKALTSCALMGLWLWASLPAVSQAEISAQPLEPLTGNATARGIGVLDPGRDGGLPLDIWQGIDGALASALLADLPNDSQLVELRELARRVLTSTVKPPAMASEDFAFERVQALLQLGYFNHARNLAEAARPQDEDRAQRLMATADLLAGDTASACAVLREVDRAASPPDGFWERVDLVCQALDGNRGAVGFLSNLLRETGNTPEILFIAANALVIDDASAAFDDQDAPFAGLDAITNPMAFALLSRLGLTVPETASLRDRLIWLNQQQAPLKQRTPALSYAVALAQAGWLNGDELRDRIALAGFETEDLIDPLGRDEADLPGGNRISLLLEAAASEAIDAAKAELLATAWADAKPVAGGVTELLAEMIASVEPGPGTNAIAPAAFLLFSALDDAERAVPWLRQTSQRPAAAIGQFIRQMDRRSGTPATMPNTALYADLLPVARAAQQALQREQPTGIAQSATMVGLGQDQANIAALTTLLTAPADTTGQAQVVLAALLLAGNQGMASLSPVLVNLLTGSLYRVGLEEEARRFARAVVLAKATELGLDGVIGIPR
ncbi:MAG: hypothetical protein AAF213_04050 [Pseudomonadota bacterium]